MSSALNPEEAEATLQAAEPMYGPGRARAISIVNRNGTVYLRAYREDAEKPSIYQLLARIALGDTSKEATGMKMAQEIPPAAALVKKKMAGARFGHTFHPRKWETLL